MKSVSSKMIIVLTLVAILSGAILSSWDSVTRPRIEAYRQMELEKAVKDVLPTCDSIKVVTTENFTFYCGISNGITESVAFQALGSGFQGNILMMVGLNSDLSKFTGLKILEQVETPGLGTKIVSDPSMKANPNWFTVQFKDVETMPEITWVKNQKPTKANEIQAITGATISSKSVVNILNQVIQKAQCEYLAAKE